MTKRPILGSAFDADFMNDAGRATSYAREIEYYRPRGFFKLARELRTIAARLDTDEARPDDADALYEAMDDADELLTSWARRVERHNFVYFGSFEHNGSVGFQINIEAAREEADIELDAGDTVPRGFSGLALFITDHGNVTAQRFSRGRMCRELFAVV